MGTKFHLQLDADREVEITLVVREADGIDSDPHTITRTPTLAEARAVQSHLESHGLLALSERSHLT